MIEGKIKGRVELMGRQGSRRKHLLDELKGTRSYSAAKEKALHCTVWRVWKRLWTTRKTDFVKTSSVLNERFTEFCNFLVRISLCLI